MFRYPKFIDNDRKSLGSVLNDIAPSYKHLSVATGYWDIAGMNQVMDNIKNYESIRILIGKEPLAHRLQKKYNIDINSPENIFPDADIKHDLEQSGMSLEIQELRETVNKMTALIKNGILKVKLFRKPRLHAKAYIFGQLKDGNSVGIIGSSNFTNAGLNNNAELNFLTDDYQTVEFVPDGPNQENGHLSWFNGLWEDAEAIEWTGDFSEILGESPLGEMTYGPYDVYIKTLMELFPEELIKPKPFTKEVQNYLHPFQNQNALSLRKKMITNGTAMLSDSVGLGKTVTAAAIIDQYIKEGKGNVMLILPSSLMNQWEKELKSEPWNLVLNRDYSIVSQQNHNQIQELIEIKRQSNNVANEIDLFVIDEAHNLRNQNSQRHQAVLEWLQEHINAHVLLLTATPINNSLMDFAHQIQLGLKGSLTSRNVPYRSENSNHISRIDLFEALKKIQSAATRAEKKEKAFNWNHHKDTLVSGLRHYVVRSTRQGIEKRSVLKEGFKTQMFPKSIVKQFTYNYDFKYHKRIKEMIEDKIQSVFEGIKPQNLNLDITEQLTQKSKHSMDIYKEIQKSQEEGSLEKISYKYNIPINLLRKNLLDDKNYKSSIITTIYKLINMLYFVPYRLDTYDRGVYGKSIPELRGLNISTDEKLKVSSQLVIHNMLHVTWLKRLESSSATLLKSVKNYQKRIFQFTRWLDKGYLVSLSDATILASEYDEDIDQAIDDYDEYLIILNEAMQEGKEADIDAKGINAREASNEKYYINQLYEDINRDLNILNVLEDILMFLSTSNRDRKLDNFSDHLVDVINNGNYGKKAIVFSFFSDTIKYLKENLPESIDNRINNFKKRSMFITGNDSNSDMAAKQFSPKSQKHTFKHDEQEVDFLFATDVLSEGQNLQDAGILINYDLHWNPIRMTQRNGRINRLGSEFENILIANARPHDELEEYLNLLNRLENKITAINHTIGTDQSILGEEINPIEFTETIEDSYRIFSMNTDVASNTMENIETKDDFFTWVDEYSIELIDFLDKHSDKEIYRIKNIPNGKWNYLPYNENDYIKNQIIGLYRAEGKIEASGEKINETSFIKIYPSGEKRGPFTIFKSEYISEDEALRYIKTTPEDNKPSVDNIEVNRSQYIEAGLTEFNAHLEFEQLLFNVQPAGRRALKSIGVHFPEINLLPVIEKGIKKSNEQKEFRSIVYQINKEIKENQTLKLSTISWFQQFIEKLIKNEDLNEIYNVKGGILFYAHK